MGEEHAGKEMIKWLLSNFRWRWMISVYTLTKYENYLEVYGKQVVNKISMLLKDLYLLIEGFDDQLSPIFIHLSHPVGYFPA